MTPVRRAAPTWSSFVVESSLMRPDHVALEGPGMKWQQADHRSQGGVRSGLFGRFTFEVEQTSSLKRVSHDH